LPRVCVLKKAASQAVLSFLKALANTSMRSLNRLAVLCAALLAIGVAYRCARPPDAPLADEVLESTVVAKSKRLLQAPQGTGALEGRIIGPEGQPLVGATVTLSLSDDTQLLLGLCTECDQPLAACEGESTLQLLAERLSKGEHRAEATLSTLTGADGRFAFKNLNGVGFRLVAAKEGYGSAVEPRAAPGQSLQLQLWRPRRLEGRLLDERAQGLKGTAYAVSLTTGIVADAQSEADGHFVFEGLGEGPFYVLGTAPQKFPEAARGVSVSEGVIELTLTALRHLTVSLEADGKPIDGTVTVMTAHVTQHKRSTEASAQFENLKKAEIEVSASANGLASVVQTVFLKEVENKVTLSLTTAGRLTITLVDSVGQPIEKADVTIENEEGKRVGRKSANRGELVEFGPLPQGSYFVGLEAKGFERKTVSVAIDKPQVEIEVVLDVLPTLSGAVFDENGRPTPGVSVLLNPTGDVAVSDGLGAFHFAVPSLGLYTLSAHHSDFGGAELKANAPQSGLELRLERKAELTVFVEADGKPVDGANAILEHAGGNFRSDVASGSQGLVSMKGMPDGEYKLAVVHEQYLSPEPVPVTLKEGKPVQVKVQLSRGALISGRVVDETRQGVADSSVYLNPRAISKAPTDAEGRFHVGPLDAAREYGIGLTGDLQVVGPTSFRPDQLNKGELIISVIRFKKYRGRVLANGQPVKHFTVNGIHEIHSPDGRFEAPLREDDGDVTFEVTAPKLSAEVFVRKAAPDLGDFELLPLQTLQGLVKDKNGAPAANAEISCTECPMGARTGPDGRFSIARAPNVSHTEIIARRGKEQGRVGIGRERPSQVEIVLEGGVRVFGQVARADGTLLAGGVLQVSEVPDYNGVPTVVVTDANGKYETVLAVGVYAFLVPTEALDGDSDPQTTARVQGTSMRLDFGPVPGTHSFEVQVNGSREVQLRMEKVGDSNWSLQPFEVGESQYVFRGLPPGDYVVVADPSDSQEQVQQSIPIQRRPIRVPLERSMRLNF
jgi:hypothetical protein